MAGDSKPRAEGDLPRVQHARAEGEVANSPQNILKVEY